MGSSSQPRGEQGFGNSCDLTNLNINLCVIVSPFWVEIFEYLHISLSS